MWSGSAFNPEAALDRAQPYINIDALFGVYRLQADLHAIEPTAEPLDFLQNVLVHVVHSPGL